MEGVDAGFVLDDRFVGFDFYNRSKSLGVVDEPASDLSIATGAENRDRCCGRGGVDAEGIDG